MADTNKNKKTTTKVEQENLDLADKLLGRLKDVNKQISEGNKILGKFNTGLDLTTGYQNKILINQSRYNDALKVNKDIQDKAKSLNQEILRQKAKIAQYEGAGASKQKLEYETQVLNQLEAQAAPTLKAYETSKKALETSKTSLDLTDKNLTTLQEISKNKQNIGKEDFKSLDYTKEIQELEEKILESTEENNTALSKALTERKSILEAAQKESEAQDKINSKIGAARDKIVEFGDSLLNLVPGGKDGFLGKMLGLDTISKNLKDNVGGAMADAFSVAGGGARGFFAAASAGASTLMASLAPILPILLAIAGVVGIVKLFMDADKAVSDLARSLNISYKEAIGVQSVAVDIATELNKSGVGAAEVTKQMIELQKATGINVGLLAKTNDQIKEVLSTTAAMASQYGLAAEETMTLATAANGAGNTVDSLVLAAEKFAEDGMVPAGEILKDIAKTSKGVLISFKGNVVALARATKTAKMLGTTLDAMQSAGESLLNIESSIVAQNKARMLLGRNINLDAARYYALQGDTESLMQEMVKAAGSVEEYENMSVLQKKALAEAMGMQVSQLDEMMFKQKELNTLGIDQQKMNDLMNDSKNGTLDIQKELAKYGKDEQKQLVQKIYDENRRAGIQEKLSKTITKVTDLLYKMVEPLLPIIDGFVESLGDGKGVLTSLSDTFSGIGKFIGSVLIPILKVTFTPLMATFSFFKTIIDKIGEAMNGIFGPVKEGESSFSVLGDVAKVLGKIFSGIGVVIADYMLAPFMRIAGIIGGVIKIFQGDFVGGIKQIGGAILSFILLPFEAVGDFIDEVFGTNLVDSVKEIFSNIADAIFDILGGVWDVIAGIFTFDGDRILEGITSIGKGLYNALVQPFMDAWDWITGWFGGNSPSKLGESIVLGISSVAESLFDFLTSPFKKAWEWITNLFSGTGSKIIDGISNLASDVWSTVTGAFKSGYDWVVNTFSNVGQKIVDGISSVGGSIVDAITAPFTQAWDSISGWLGFSPSELGNGIVKGISSVSGDVESSLTKPFDNAEQQVSKSASAMSDAVSNISGDASISIKGIDSAGISQIKDIEKDLRRIKVDKIKEKLEELSDAFNAMDWSLLKEFANLATVNLGDAGKSLITGINSLTGISKSVNLDTLEDVFDQLSDTLDELNWEDLKIFSGLATTNLAAAGKSLIDGINSLTGITKDVNLSALEDTFSDLMDTLEELDWDVLKTFSSLATTNLSEAGKSLIGGINSLTGITKDVNLDSLKDTFEQLTDTLNELNWEDLKIFATLATSNLAAAGKAMIDGINSLTGIDSKVNLDSLKGTFEKLTDTLNELDWEDLKVFASLATANLANAGKAIIDGINSLSGIKGKINLGAAEDAFDELEDVLDSLNLDDLTKFANLAGKDLSSVGSNIKNGLSTLSTIKEVSLDGVGDIFDDLSDSLDNLDLEIINKFATADLTTLSTNVTAITNAMTALSTVGTIDLSGISNNGDLMASFLDDISDIDYDGIDGLADALLNLADSYADLSDSIKNISDEDLNRIQQVASVSGNSSSSGLSSFMSNLFGNDDNDEADTKIESTIEPKQPVATSPITPVMQPIATVATQPAAMQSETVVNNQNDNSKLEGLLRELITKVDQPVIVKLGNKTVAEMSDAISLRKSYGANINGYRS